MADDEAILQRAIDAALDVLPDGWAVVILMGKQHRDGVQLHSVSNTSDELADAMMMTHLSEQNLAAIDDDDPPPPWAQHAPAVN